MKLKVKYKLLGLLSTIAIPIIAITLTSCGNNNFAKVDSPIVTKLHYSQPSTILLSKTLSEWQNEFKKGNYDLFVQGLNEINNNFIDTNFKINEFTSATINSISSPSDNPIFTNVIVIFKNNNNILEITIDNLFVFPPNNIKHPNLELVKNPINIQQVNLSSIANIDPTIILANEWTTQLNNVAPNGSVYIPNTLYYLKSRQFISETIYQLIYTINDQYLPMIDSNNFPNIIFNIEISPNINKTLKKEFTLSSNDTKTYFPNISPNDILNMSEIQVYNLLCEYVAKLGNIQPIVDCINPSTNLVYNYLIVDETITNSILIKFSSNPNTSLETIYFYSFRLFF